MSGGTGLLVELLLIAFAVGMIVGAAVKRCPPYE
jgi:hypothetical protein